MSNHLKKRPFKAFQTHFKGVLKYHGMSHSLCCIYMVTQCAWKSSGCSMPSVSTLNQKLASKLWKQQWTLHSKRWSCRFNVDIFYRVLNSKIHHKFFIHVCLQFKSELNENYLASRSLITIWLWHHMYCFKV